MTERVLPDADTIQAALASHHGPWGPDVRVLSVRDLSTGLGQAAVLRVSLATPHTEPSPWIVKILGWGRQTLLDSRDRLLDRREAHFYGSSISDLLPHGLTIPRAATVFSHHDFTWLVMRDVGAVLQQSWTPESAVVAARRAALMYVPGTVRPGLLDAPWLEQEGWAAYVHHVPAGHENLEALSDDPRLRTLFAPEQIRALHACLDAADELSARARELPSTLVHGDLTPRNAGLDPRGDLALIDWEHVGVGPVGFDLGTFVSVYRAFGGHGELDEPGLLETYGRAVSELADADLMTAAALGFATAHLTWGIHLRLGPGLTAIRQGLDRATPAALAAGLDDIRSGCLRALSWAMAAGAGAMAGPQSAFRHL